MIYNRFYTAIFHKKIKIRKQRQILNVISDFIFSLLLI